MDNLLVLMYKKTKDFEITDDKRSIYTKPTYSSIRLGSFHSV